MNSHEFANKIKQWIRPSNFGTLSLERLASRNSLHLCGEEKIIKKESGLLKRCKWWHLWINLWQLKGNLEINIMLYDVHNVLILNSAQKPNKNVTQFSNLMHGQGVIIPFKDTLSNSLSLIIHKNAFVSRGERKEQKKGNRKCEHRREMKSYPTNKESTTKKWGKKTENKI